MFSPAFEEYLAGLRRTMIIVWAAILAGVVMYAVVGVFVARAGFQGGGPDPEQVDLFDKALPAIALAAVFSSVIAKKTLLSDARLRAKMPREGPVEVERTIKSVTTRTDISKCSPEERRVAAALHGTIFWSYTLCWALADCAAIVGLAHMFMRRDVNFLFPYVAVALSVHGALFPFVHGYAARLRDSIEG